MSNLTQLDLAQQKSEIDIRKKYLQNIIPLPEIKVPNKLENSIYIYIYITKIFPIIK